MLKKAIIISMLSIFVVIALFATKVLNIQNMEEIGRDASSYHDWSAILYLVCGIILVFISIWTYKLHIVAGIIPLGFGIGALFYGLYICWAKGYLGLTMYPSWLEMII